MSWLVRRGVAVRACATWRGCAVTHLLYTTRGCAHNSNSSSAAAAAIPAAKVDATLRCSEAVDTPATSAQLGGVSDMATSATTAAADEHVEADDVAALSAALVRVMQRCGDGAPRAHIEMRALELYRTEGKHSSSDKGCGGGVCDDEQAAAATARERRVLSRAWRTLTMQLYYGCEQQPRHTTNGTDDSSNNDNDADDASSAVAVYVCDWHATLRAVAAALPYEGVDECVFVSLLRQRCPHLLPRVCASLCGAVSLAQWVCTHGAAYVLVTRSAVTQEPLYYAAHCNNVYPSYMQQQQHAAAEGDTNAAAAAGVDGDDDDDVRLRRVLHIALDALQRPKQLPVWTRVDELRPLLLPSLLGNNNNRGNKTSNDNNDGDDGGAGEAAGADDVLFDALARLQAQQCIELRADVCVRAAAARSCALLVLVDTVSLHDDAAVAWQQLLRKHVVAGGSDASSATTTAAAVVWPRGAWDVRLLRARSRVGGRSNDAAAPPQTTVAGGAMGLPSSVYCTVRDVAVEAVLDAEHVAAALVSTLTPAAAAASVNSNDDDSNGNNGGGAGGKGGGVCAAAGAALRVLVLCGDDKAAAFADALRALRRPGLRFCVGTPARLVT